MSRDPVAVQFIWHLHQPYYGLPNRPIHQLPWVRLHATRSYYDIARALEERPGIKATVNFSGSLLRQLREVLDDGHRDTWWGLSLKPAATLAEHDQQHLLRHFFALDRGRVIQRYPRYLELLERRDRGEAFDTGAFRDLQVWFNLAWFGSYAREERPIVLELIDKGRGFTEAEKEALLEQQIDVMHQIIPLYRDLHRRGQVEISSTPMYHPILPLIVDSDVAASARPDSPLPQRYQARGDATEHLWAARSITREVLGVDVDGMWPAEGALSPGAHSLFAEHDVQWVASDQALLARSIPDFDPAEHANRPYRLGDSGPVIFFQDGQLSDLIGAAHAFEDPRAAANQLIARVRETPGPVATVVVDVQRTLERHPDGGSDFIAALFEELERAPDIASTTPSTFIEDVGCQDELSTLSAGSWRGADFGAWLGSPETNRAWEALQRTRYDFLRRVETHAIDPDVEELIWDAILVAEGSDWFAWYGDPATPDADADFDRLFREHLRFVYEALGLEPADFVERPIASAVPPIAFEAPQRFISPRIDGATDSYFEWDGAGRYVIPASVGAMFESERIVESIYIGFDLEHLFVRLDWTPEFARHDVDVRMVVQHDAGVFIVELRPGGVIRWRQDDSEIPLFEIALGASLEAALPWTDVELAATESFGVRFEVRANGGRCERHPEYGTFGLVVPDANFDARNWIV